MNQVIEFLKDNPQYESSFLPSDEGAPPDPSGPPEDGDEFNCKCGMCQRMPTEREQLCCRSRVRGRCMLFTAATVMERSILDQVTLEIAVENNNLVFANRDDFQSNKFLRHMAYRQFVVWHYGNLGVGIRVVVPSCVVREIRRRYPSTDGHYTGFIPTRIY